jgi:hypothetical protein
MVSLIAMMRIVLIVLILAVFFLSFKIISILNFIIIIGSHPDAIPSIIIICFVVTISPSIILFIALIQS